MRGGDLLRRQAFVVTQQDDGSIRIVEGEHGLAEALLFFRALDELVRAREPLGRRDVRLARGAAGATAQAQGGGVAHDA